MDNAPALNLLDEKNELERALMSCQELLKNTCEEKEQVVTLFSEFKVHFESIRTQSSNYQQRLVDEMRLRKQVEEQFEVRLAQMGASVESKQRELDNLAQKMVLPVDKDILRMRIQKDLEAKFRFELESRM